MAKDEQESDAEKELVKSFSAATVMQDKEVAALMGNGLEERDGQTLPGGLISKYGYLEGKDSSAQKKKDNQFKDLLLYILIHNSIKWVQEIISFHLLQMQLLAEKIMATQKRLKELLEEENVLKEVLEYYQEERAFELDSSGRLKNHIAEKALQKLEVQTRKKIDRSGIETYKALLKILEHNEDKKLANESDIELAKTDYNHHKKKKDEAQVILNDLKSGDPLRYQNALQQIESLSFEQEVEISLKANKQGIAYSIENTEEVLTKEDMEWDDFSFNFPPVQDEFESASTGDSGEKEKEENPSPTKTRKLPTHSPTN